MTASATSHHFAHESTGPGGRLYWSERRDGHRHAEATGGHFDVVPMTRGYHLWWCGNRGNAGYVDLGHHGSLGSAFAGARFYLDEGVPAQTAAEGVSAKAAGEEAGACCGDANCAHRHPPSVPSTPCKKTLVWHKNKKGWISGGGEFTIQKKGKKWLLHAASIDLKHAGKLPEHISADAAKKVAQRVVDSGLMGAREASLSEAPAPMHIEIPADAYAQWVAYGDTLGPLDTTEKVYKLLSGYAHKQDQEVFLVVVTDLHFKLRSVTEIARGERSSVGVGIEEVMRATLMTPGVAHMCCAHQHPTGKCRPSKADRDLHRSIEEAAKSYASLTYLDHVVIGVGEYHSIREGKSYKVK